MQDKSQFSEDDLARVSELYDLNFEKLLKAHREGNTEEHNRCIKEEARLNKLDIQIRKDLGRLARDPCPLTAYSNTKKTSIERNISCASCTGYYVQVDNRMRMADVGERCAYKNLVM